MFSSMIQNLLSSSGQANAMQRAVQMKQHVNNINSQFVPVARASEEQGNSSQVVSFDKVLQDKCFDVLEGIHIEVINR